MNSDTKRQLFLLVGFCVAIALVAGYFVLTHWNPFQETAVVSVNEEGLETSDEEKNQETYSDALSTFQFESFEGRFADVLSLYQQLDSIDERALPHLLVQSNEITSSAHRSAVQRAIVLKSAEFDPIAALKGVTSLPRSRQEPLVAIVFEQWSIADLDSALKYAQGLDYSYRSTALRSIFSTRDDLSQNRLEEIASRLGGNAYGKRVIIESQASATVVEQPLQVWNRLVEEDLLRDSQYAGLIKLVAQERADQEGLHAVVQMLDRLIEERDSHATFDTVVESVGMQDPNALLATIRALPMRKQELMLPRFFSVWSRLDPVTAWNVVESVRKDTGINNIVSIVIDRWARSNPRDLLESIEQMAQQDQLMAIERAISELARHSVEEALKLLAQFQNEDRDISSAAQKFVNVWSRRDPEAAMDWLLTKPEEEFGHDYSSMVERGLESLASVNPQRAFQIAIAQPLPVFGVPLETKVIRELAQSDLDLAIEYLGQVREENRGKLWAYKHIGRELIERGSPTRILEMGEELSEKEQEDYFQSVIHDWASSQPLTLLNSLESIESESLQSMAAQQLVMMQDSRPILTEEQLSVARSYFEGEVILASDLTPQELREKVEEIRKRAQEQRESDISSSE